MVDSDRFNGKKLSRDMRKGMLRMGVVILEWFRL